MDHIRFIKQSISMDRIYLYTQQIVFDKANLSYQSQFSTLYSSTFSQLFAHTVQQTNSMVERRTLERVTGFFNRAIMCQTPDLTYKLYIPHKVSAYLTFFFAAFFSCVCFFHLYVRFLKRPYCFKNSCERSTVVTKSSFFDSHRIRCSSQINC